MNAIYESELYHHGIKGMKWGVRRYQNKDGTLTAEGRKHFENYNTEKKLHDNVSKEAVKVWKKNPSLWKEYKYAGNVRYAAESDDFGRTLKQMSIKGSSYYNARKKYIEHKTINAQSIKEGEKIVKKIVNKRERQVEKDWKKGKGWDSNLGLYEPNPKYSKIVKKMKSKPTTMTITNPDGTKVVYKTSNKNGFSKEHQDRAKKAQKIYGSKVSYS